MACCQQGPLRRPPTGPGALDFLISQPGSAPIQVPAESSCSSNLGKAAFGGGEANSGELGRESSP